MHPSVIASILVCLVLSSSSLSAQADDEDHERRKWTDRVFVNVNAGYQTASSGFEYRDTQTIFEEEASADVAADGKSDFAFDVGGGVRLFDNLGVGVSYSRYDTKLDSVLEASIPHPILFNMPAVDSLEVPLARKEDALHISAVYTIPVTSKFQIGLLGGPTHFRYEQEAISTFMIHLRLDFPEFTIDLRDPVLTTLEGSAWGYHVGADVTYLFTDHIGVGGLVRYSRASTDVENPLEAGRTMTSNTSASLELGGLQLLAGVRIRF